MWRCPRGILPFLLAACAGEASAPDHASKAVPRAAAASGQPPPWFVSADKLPLRTRGRDVVSSVTGEVVQLSCVNWYGSHLEQWVPNGLAHQTVDGVAARIAELGFNCVRFPFSLDMISAARVPEAERALAANPGLVGKSPLQVFDAAVDALSRAGLLVILNNHVSSGKWCCGTDDGEGLWYTDKYPESSWLEVLGLLAARYRNNSLVVGFDIRNEIRASELGTPTWGDGVGATDWAIAAVKGAEQVLAANKDMLIIISGLDYSMYLCDVPHKPLHLEASLRRRIVYTVHEYSWYHSDLGLYHIVASYFVWAYLLLFFGGCLILGAVVLASSFCKAGWCPGRLPGDGAALRVLRALRGVLRLCGAPAPAHRRGGQAVQRRLCAAASASVLFLGCLWLGELFPSPCSKRSDSWLLALVGLAPSFLVSVLCWVRFFLLGFHLLQPYSKHPLGAVVPVSIVGRQLAAAAETAGERRGSAPGGGGASPAEGSDGGAAEDMEINDASDRQGILSNSPSAAVGLAGLRPRLLLGLLLLALAALAGLVLFWRRLASYELFAAELDLRWGFLLSGASVEDSPSSAPIWLGEFGTNTDDRWWRHLMRYVREHRVGWAYWPINGEKWVGIPESFGLLEKDMSTVRYPWAMQALQELARDGVR